MLVLIKPKDGVRVLDPATRPPSPLPPEGRRVELTAYWRRRLRDGDVERARAAKPTAKKRAKE